MPIHVELANADLWETFNPNIEMMTSRPGRQLFPHLDYTISGLETDVVYSVSLHFEQVGETRHKENWEEDHKNPVKIHKPSDPVTHKGSAESPGELQRGEFWMSQTVSFSSVKITHNQENTKCMQVNSLHKYQPVVTITRFGEEKGEEFRLKISEFIAVTSYQSKRMIKLKIERNKYAKRQKRERSESEVKNKRKLESSESEDVGTKKMKTTSSESFNTFGHPGCFPPQQLQMNQNFQMHLNPFSSLQTPPALSPEVWTSNYQNHYQTPPTFVFQNQMLHQQPTPSSAMQFWNPVPSYQPSYQLSWNQPLHHQYAPMLQFVNHPTPHQYIQNFENIPPSTDNRQSFPQQVFYNHS